MKAYIPPSSTSLAYVLSAVSTPPISTDNSIVMLLGNKTPRSQLKFHKTIMHFQTRFSSNSKVAWATGTITDCTNSKHGKYT